MLRVVFHPRYRDYDLGPEHPFSPLRLDMTLDLLAALGHPLDPVAARPAEPDDLHAVHDPEYVTAVESACGAVADVAAARFGLGTPDTPVVAGLAEAARWIAGGTAVAARLAAEGDGSRVLQLGGGFHHARRRLAAGFCIYNDLAFALRGIAQRRTRVAYLDLDVHHGDGVQEILYADENVMTISLHESGEYLFPGSGWLHELGQGMGRGLKLNLPLEPFTEGDGYLEALRRTVEPALEFFRPDLLMVQAGADAHFSDPLADLMLTTRDYERIFRQVLGFADSYCGGRVVFTLGGGYAPTATARVWAILALVLGGHEVPETTPPEWRKAWANRLGVPAPELLHDPPDAFEPVPRRAEIDRHNLQLVERLMDAVAPLWW